MNVSSVKNLNGEVFSAVQDASLTNVVQTIEGQIANKLDSSSFSDVSGTFYPTTNPSSFVNEDWVTAQGYITGVDLSEYAKRAFVLSSIESATSGKLDASSFASVSSDFLTTSFEIPESATWNETSNVVQTNSAQWGQGGDEFPASADEAVQYVQTNSAGINDTVNNVQTNSGVWGGGALPISAGPGIKFEMVNNTLVASTYGYVWQSASLFHTDTPATQTTYTLSDSCSNYDKLEVDFYDINNWRTQMDCPIPPNLASSGTRGGYFSVVHASTATGSNIWFKAFNWTAAGNTWTCYCSELTGQGGSTAQTVNANQPDNAPKVVNIIGWKRVGGN